MTFGNTNNEKRKNSGTNTRASQFYNSNGSESTLVIGYWATGGFNSVEFLNLKIHPLLPENQRTQSNMYDYKSVISTLLPLQKAVELLEICKEIERYIENDSYDFEDMGIPVKEAFVCLSSASKEGFTTDGIVLKIWGGVDSSGNATHSLKYLFNKSQYLTGFKGDGSEYQTGKSMETEFKMFKLILEEFTKAATYAQAHVNRGINSYYQNEVVKTSLYEIKNKLGIQPAFNNNNNNGNYNQGNYNTNFGNNSTSYFESRRQDNIDNQNLGSVENGGTIINGSLPI